VVIVERFDAIGVWHRAFSVLANIQAGGYDVVLGALAHLSSRTLISLPLWLTSMLSPSNTINFDTTSETETGPLIIPNIYT
jgi:hypothetical protein